jgi:hypothetical protein
MFRLSPSKQVLQNLSEIAVLVPNYTPDSFTYVPGNPESLLTLCNNNTLLYLHTSHTEADRMLRVTEAGPIKVQCIQAPAPAMGQSWLTVLDVNPKLNVYALLSNEGTLLFFKLSVRVRQAEASYEAEELKQEKCTRSTFKKGSSLCLKDQRYFLLETSDHVLKVYQCDTGTYKVSKAENVPWVVQLMLKDYNTENNILGCKQNVVFYKEEAIATLPPGWRVLSIFGTQCNAFQMLVQNARGGVEWWRWTGAECEAVSLPDNTAVPKGNLLWF